MRGNLQASGRRSLRKCSNLNACVRYQPDSRRMLETCRTPSPPPPVPKSPAPAHHPARRMETSISRNTRLLRIFSRSDKLFEERPRSGPVGGGIRPEAMRAESTTSMDRLAMVRLTRTEVSRKQENRWPNGRTGNGFLAMRTSAITRAQILRGRRC